MLIYAQLKPLRTELPFLLAVSKASYVHMGGYDEDFTGRCYDDDDFIDRLKASAHQFVKTSAHCIHLWHERVTLQKDKDHDRVAHNKKLYMDRRGQIMRNIKKDWGRLA
jgi:predicted glycosyltransferase involved in capsule biosynthesis